jgi:hypothetical protein
LLLIYKFIELRLSILAENEAPHNNNKKTNRTHYSSQQATNKLREATRKLKLKSFQVLINNTILDKMEIIPNANKTTKIKGLKSNTRTHQLPQWTICFSDPWKHQPVLCSGIHENRINREI